MTTMNLDTYSYRNYFKYKNKLSLEEIKEIESMILKNIGYYIAIKSKLQCEILNMKINGVKGCDSLNEVNLKWNNKIKSIKQKEKGIKRIDNIINRLFKIQKQFSNKEDCIDHIILKDIK